MSTEIVPNRGAGKISFGMTKAAVQAALGVPDREFVRSQFSPCVEWDYTRRGINVIFDRRASCAAVMLTPPTDARLGAVRLLSIPARDAWAALRALDPGARVEDGSLTSMRLGISIYAPEADEEPTDPAFSVLVLRSDYFDLK